VIVGSFLASKEKSGRKNAARTPSSSASPESFDVNGGHSTKLLAALTKSRTKPENLKSPDRCSAIRLRTSVNVLELQVRGPIQPTKKVCTVWLCTVHKALSRTARKLCTEHPTRLCTELPVRLRTALPTS
jgi:hypothetical protein